jgi:subtilisin family serine protease
MKTFLLLFCFICSFGLGFSQNQASDFTGNKSDQTRNPRNDLMNFVPNEVLVKFKDAVPVTAGVRVKAAGVSSVDKVLQAHGITSLEKLFPTAQQPQKTRIMKSPQGKDMIIPSLDKIYRVAVPPTPANSIAPTTIFQLIEELKALPEVEYAEPNYIYSIDNLQPAGPILTAADVAKLQIKQISANGPVVPNDPLYGQQWYIPAVKADSVWLQTTGDTTQVIAILDTGVDWNHPDLKNKIWTNLYPNTTPDANGVLNDVRGWDYINNDNNPTDDNSHGTHVAGIAAAETNNGIGIAGVNWKAKIMPIKVFQSSGRGDAATITKGIIYAANHGATVINMSFGSYARSQAMDDALANAYQTSILVAASGNDAIKIGPCSDCKPFFPAALSYVLGVQAPEADFSNNDQDGPTYSLYDELFNYEQKGPGTNILSTVPNGNYRVLQGTSMATPIISGAISLYRKLNPAENESNETMWVKLIQATGQYLNLNKALTIIPKPEISFLNKTMVDTLGHDDKDGRVDAGERIQLWFRARNTGGQVDSVFWKIRLAEFEDATTCTILKPTSSLGSISPYATLTSEKDPMVFDISPKVANGRDITFDLLSWYKGSADTIVRKFIFTPENGEQLLGVMDSVKVLYPNKLYLVNSSFKVGNNGTLIIKPGAKIMIYNGKPITVKGGIIAQGKPDSLIQVIGYNPPPGSGDASLGFLLTDWQTVVQPNGDVVYPTRLFDYCYFEKFSTAISPAYVWCNPGFDVTNCNFNYIATVTGVNNFKNNVFVSDYDNGMVMGMYLKYNNIIGVPTANFFYNGNLPGTVFSNNELKYNNLINLSMSGNGSSNNAWISENTKYRNEYNGGFYKDVKFTLQKYRTYGGPDFQNVQNEYWGTSDSTKIENFIYDFMDDPTIARAVFKPYLKAPSDSCHAVVWKVLVNGKDAQDQTVEPVGVGKQRFDIYFNRPMDKTIAPKVSFGVRYPFSTTSVDEDGNWSVDGRIYTVYKTIKITTGDGLNRIRVEGAKEKDGWNYEIPLENMRFEFLINAAGSASLEFMATAGLGKVNLEWNNSNLNDGLGFNMYRMEHINDSTLSVPEIINTSLIADTLYTDYSVIPNKKYYYYYKIVRSNLTETDSSKVVSATPFTAAKGDANGDLSVNVLDITTIVAYLLNNNPQPFIVEAADLNSDNTINVLDIVGVVNKILNVPHAAPGISMTRQVDLYMHNDTLFANSNTDIGGIQLDLKGINSLEDIQILTTLKSFESGNSIVSDSLRLIFYSMSGKCVPAGERIPLLKLKSGSSILDAIFGETNGSPIKVNYIMTRIGDIQNNMNQTVAELGQNFPNPVNGKTIIPIRIYEPVDEAVLRVINMMGQEVEVIRLIHPYTGEHLLSWNSSTHKGLFVYTLEINNANQKQICPVKKMIVE